MQETIKAELKESIEVKNMVLKTLVPKESEMLTKDGSCFLTRIMPYRTAENVIDGLVITYVDINRMKRAERAGTEATAYYRSIIDTLKEPLAVLDQELHVLFANNAFCDLFRVTAQRVQGTLFYRLGNDALNIPELRRGLENILPKNAPMDDFEVTDEFPEIGRRVLQINARRLARDGGAQALILLAIRDVSVK